MGRWGFWRACAAALVVALLAAGQPAEGAVTPATGAATARLALAKPAKVARPTLGHARVSGSRASVRVSWSATRGATSYQVFYDGARSMSRARSRRTHSTHLALRHLETSQLYCVRVRAVHGHKYGALSALVCRRTPHRVGRAKPAWVIAQQVQSTSAGPRTALTLRWPRVPGARRYTVTVGPSYDVQRSHARSVLRGFQTTGRAQETYVIRGLMPGQRYCFQVRGRYRKGTGALSTSHCKITMPASKAVRPTGFAVRMATYNICGAAAHCQGRKHLWRLRRPYISQLIRSAGVDVVAIQETRKRLADVVADLKPHGFVAACQYAHAQALLVRTSAYRVVPGSTGGLRFRGDISHGGCWAKLQHRATGSLVAVASVHLRKGRRRADARRRDVQAAKVVTLMQQKYGAIGAARTPPFLIGGDFNSHRGHEYDGPRVRLARSGFLDGYDISGTYTAPNRNSANQFRHRPLTSTIWGAHPDRIFVPPAATVTGWRTVARMRAGRYLAPIPSDHNPVAMTIYLPVTGSGPIGGGGKKGGGGLGCLLGLLCRS